MVGAMQHKYINLLLVFMEGDLQSLIGKHLLKILKNCMTSYLGDVTGDVRDDVPSHVTRDVMSWPPMTSLMTSS